MMDSERQQLLPAQSYIGKVGKSSRWRTQFACGAVLITETLERIAFYGAIGNLVFFLNADPLLWMSYNASYALFIFMGLSYMTSIFGGWVADAILGRFKTILFFFLIYIAGYIFLPFLHPWPNEDINEKSLEKLRWCAVIPQPWNTTTGTRTLVPSAVNYTTSSPYTTPAGDERCAWAVFLSLTIMGIGNGAIKANIAPFGADQVKQEGPSVMRVFFNWFYWCINIGALISLSVIVWVQQNISFFWGLVVPNISLVLAMLVFCCGGVFYTMQPARGSVISNICRILCESCRNKKKKYSVNPSGLQENGVAIRATDETVEHVGSHDITPSCLDYAKVQYGGSFHETMVDDVKTLGKISCIFLTMVPYWAVYFQMETTYVIQGLHMKLDFTETGKNISHHSKSGPHLNQIPASWLSLFDVIFLIILIPVMDRVIYPCLDKRGMHLGLCTRIAIGLVFALVSVVFAGVVEIYRNYRYHHNGTYPQYVGQTLYNAADISIFWQVPQYAFIGISEVFASVAGLEMAYSHAPRSMEGVIMGLYQFTLGLGSMLGSLFIFSFQDESFPSVDHGDINNGRLYVYFFFLGGVELVSIIIFLLVTRKLNLAEKSIATKELRRHRLSQPVGDQESSRNIRDIMRKRHQHLYQRASSNSSADSLTS